MRHDRLTEAKTGEERLCCAHGQLNQPLSTMSERTVSEGAVLLLGSGCISIGALSPLPLFSPLFAS